MIPCGSKLCGRKVQPHSSLLCPSDMSLGLSVCCHETNCLCPCMGWFQPAQALYSSWESSGGCRSSCSHATDGHQHLLPIPPAPGLREVREARLALVTLLAHHARFAAAPAMTITLWAKGTCRKRGRKGLDRHLLAMLLAGQGEQSTTLSLQQQSHLSNRCPPLGSQHGTETLGLAVKAAPA